MKQLIIISGLILSLFVTCKSNNNDSKVPNNENLSAKTTLSLEDKIKELLTEKNVDTSKVFVIEDKCVFIIQMSTEESESLENKNPDSYETYSENANNVAASVYELLERLEINNYWSDRRYVKFKHEGKDYLIDTRLKDLAGNYCLLFKDNSSPKLIEMELLSEDILTEYFNK